MFGWFKESISGHDGKASSRKLTTLAGMVMITTTWFGDLFFDLTISETMLIILGVIVLIGAGYMTAQNIVDLLKRPQTYYGEDIYSFGRKASDGQDPPVEG